MGEFLQAVQLKSESGRFRLFARYCFDLLLFTSICSVLSSFAFKSIPGARFTKADSQHPIMPEPPLKDSHSSRLSSFVRQADHPDCRLDLDYLRCSGSRLRALDYRLTTRPCFELSNSQGKSILCAAVTQPHKTLKINDARIGERQNKDKPDLRRFMVEWGRFSRNTVNCRIHEMSNKG
jgi:hypothetical protein